MDTFRDAAALLLEEGGRPADFVPDGGAEVACAVLLSPRDPRIAFGRQGARHGGWKLTVQSAAVPFRPRPELDAFRVAGVLYGIVDVRLDPAAATFDCDVAPVA